MFKLLHEEKNYLNLLKESVAPESILTEEEKIIQELDYLDYMVEIFDVFLDEEYINEVQGWTGGDLSAFKNQLKDLVGAKTNLKYKIAKLTPADGETKQALYNKLYKIDKQIGAIKDKIAQAASGAGKAVAKGAEKAGEYAKDVGQQVSQKAGEVGKQVSAGAGKAASAVQKFAGTTGGKYAMAGAAAAGAAVAAYAAYKRFFSAAAKACKGKGGAEKTACMKQYKLKGLQAAMSKCGSDAKCKAKFQKKIGKLKG